MRKIFLCLIFIFAFGASSVLAAEATPEDTPDLDTEVFFRRVKEVEVPIIMYHLITENQKYIGKYGISPAELESDLAYLKKNGYNTIVMQDLINFVERGKKLPKNPIMLTFDDGNFGDYNYLLPLLKQYKSKAVLGVIGSAADKFTKMAEEIPQARYPNLTWPQIKELHESGHAEIQNHSYDLHGSGGSGRRKGESAEAYHARLLADLRKFQELCQEHLSHVPTAFIYPLGVISKGSREVIEELGMVGSFSCEELTNIIRQGDKDCLFSLNRFNRPHGRDLETILGRIPKKKS